MIYKFDAKCIYCYIEDEVIIVVAGDDDYSPNNFLIVSRLDDDCPIDRCIGLQANFIEHEMSGVISNVSIDQHKIVVALNESGKSATGFDCVQVMLPQKNDNQKLKTFVKKIFSGSSVEVNL